MLKSDCKVEYLGHRQSERIERAVTINAVIAWRLAVMTLMGRDTPELPPETFFSEIELAMLGGYINFKRMRHAHPGRKVMWEGYIRLTTVRQPIERARGLSSSPE